VRAYLSDAFFVAFKWLAQLLQHEYQFLYFQSTAKLKMYHQPPKLVALSQGSQSLSMLNQIQNSASIILSSSIFLII